MIGLDQTSWPRLDGKADKPWQMWCFTIPDAVVHRIRRDKSADTFRDLVGEFRGAIVCDALRTHEAGVRGNDAIALAGCWAHVFSLATKWIGSLYEIDSRADGDLEKKAALRQTESAEVLATMKTWLWNQATLKTLSIGHAAAYAVAASWKYYCLKSCMARLD